MDDIAKATNEVRAAYDQLSSGRVFYGSTLDRINATQTFLNSEKLQLTQQTSDLVGVDAHVAATNLANAETARNAALQAASPRGKPQPVQLSRNPDPLAAASNPLARLALTHADCAGVKMIGCCHHDGRRSQRTAATDAAAN